MHWHTNNALFSTNRRPAIIISKIIRYSIIIVKYKIYCRNSGKVFFHKTLANCSQAINNVNILYVQILSFVVCSIRCGVAPTLKSGWKKLTGWLSGLKFLLAAIMKRTAFLLISSLSSANSKWSGFLGGQSMSYPEEPCWQLPTWLSKDLWIFSRVWSRTDYFIMSKWSS